MRRFSAANFQKFAMMGGIAFARIDFAKNRASESGLEESSIPRFIAAYGSLEKDYIEL
jgi:hypothetical protein